MKLVDLPISPTTAYNASLKKWHPAVRAFPCIEYWPNVTFPTEFEAHAWAETQVQIALDTTNQVVGAWHLKDITEP